MGRDDIREHVRKAQEAATATPIRKASGWTCNCSARRMLTGAAMIVVALLLRMSDSVIVTTISSSRLTQAGRPPVAAVSQPAI
ncbi:MAG: hypothetical protein ACK4N5_06560, partial [Myxococcales bacterium]